MYTFTKYFFDNVISSTKHTNNDCIFYYFNKMNQPMYTKNRILLNVKYYLKILNKNSMCMG